MKNESKTLYIPLYGKASVSRRGIIIEDKKAEEIWDYEQFPLKGKSHSKWLALFMAMRASVMDKKLSSLLEENPGSTVIHIGCGLDSRCERVRADRGIWYDIDLPEVIEIRKKYFSENEKYKMLGASAEESGWVSSLPDSGKVFVVMEGLSMYLSEEAVSEIFDAVSEKYPGGEIIMDAYTSFAVRVSEYKNPIKDVGALPSFGIDDPKIFQKGKFRFSGELCMTPDEMISELSGFEKAFFRKMFCGSFAKKLYKIYTYEF